MNCCVSQPATFDSLCIAEHLPANCGEGGGLGKAHMELTDALIYFTNLNNYVI